MKRNTSGSYETKEAHAVGGLSFWGLLGIVFIVLKLCGVINWSWWLVLLPLYGPCVLLVAFLVFCLVMAIIAGQIK